MDVGTKTIETVRLILRRFVMSDAQDMHNNWGCDSKVTEFLSWKPHENFRQTKNILRKWCMWYHKKSVYNWAIQLKENGQVVGGISVVNKQRVCFYEGKKAVVEKEIGYCLGYDWWNKGIMSEALSGVIKFLFENTDTTRITAKHNTENPASGKVMQKAGMIYEGTLRKSHTSNHGVEDICVYSILRDEYFANRK